MPRLLEGSNSSYLPQHAGNTSLLSRGTLRATSAANLSIGHQPPSVPSKRIQKVPSRTTSFQINNARAPSLLPDFRSEHVSNNSPDARHRSSTYFKASEKGKGNVLPTTSTSSPRGGYATDGWGSRGRKIVSDSFRDNMSQRLRSRRRTSSTGEMSSLEEQSRHGGILRGTLIRGKASWSAADEDYKAHNKRSSRSYFYTFNNMRKREWFQVVVFCMVTYMVFDSYKKAVNTMERLDQFRSEESLMLMHLQRIEQQSIRLHENLSRLGDVSQSILNSDSRAVADSSTDSVDSNLIRVQTQQLYQMEEELDHELRALQAKMQNVARSNIIRTFGEGPVQISLDLDFPHEDYEGKQNTISILLWYDTPHAAWTWLQQIQRGEWNGASFTTGKSVTIDAAPVVANAGTLDFVEKSPKKHEAWTVGLADNAGNLGMFINLQDNAAARKHDVCVGKVVDGFDALQRLVDFSRQKSRRLVSIRQATAAHLTRNQRSI